MALPFFRSLIPRMSKEPDTSRPDSSTPPPVSRGRTSPYSRPNSPEIATQPQITTETATAPASSHSTANPPSPTKSHSTSSSQTARPSPGEFPQETIEASNSNPPLRHPTSHSSLNSNNGAEIRSSKTEKTTNSRPLSTTFDDQRRGETRGLGNASSTKVSEPVLQRQSVMSVGTGTTLRDSRGSGSLLGPELEKKPENEVPNANVTENKEDEPVYPGPLALTLLVTGIALNLFLNSLDRTIITTVSTFHPIAVR